MRLTLILPMALAGALAAPVAAQTLDVTSLSDITDTSLVSSDGTPIGEIEDVLVDAEGKPVAVTVDVEDGFLDLGDDEVIFTMDELTFENGNYMTDKAATDIEGLPRRAD